MRWNNGKNRKLFEEVQSRLKKEYLSAGMTEEQIQAMYEFDLALYKSDRIFYLHTVSVELNEDYIKNTLQMCNSYEYSYNGSERYGWIEELESLYYAVIGLSAREKEILTLYVFEGYTQKEIAAKLDCSCATICNQLKKIKNKLAVTKGS